MVLLFAVRPLIARTKPKAEKDKKKKRDKQNLEENYTPPTAYFISTHDETERDNSADFSNNKTAYAAGLYAQNYQITHD